tara:strand:+ start:363 stop:602 length:240 start_codon:yes stop_codon:yes gene_type:complete
MGLRIIYKGGEQKACSYTEAQNLVANEGWSWNNSAPAPKAVKKTAKPKKAKVEVEAVELKPVEGEDLKIIDFGNIDEEK